MNVSVKAPLPGGLDAGSARRFRDGMALLAGAVTIVTTDGGNGRHGFTATAVCSVSDMPPTLLVCINRATSAHPHVLDHGVLAVNVLAGAQQALSSAFGSRSKTMEERFAGGRWRRGVTGAPLLEGALACFECRVGRVVEAGTHTVVFAQVLDVHLPGEGADGLVWFARRYAVLPASC
ncbi:flavin mononucleotide reductase [Gluconacetobacter sacchari DSM 12717]|uniref:Flavin reductase n=2 Tax=Gluconacetobacter sacchari TaxID=92759 RepID=A0A7W4IGX0_9PROT|nr:flavin reductase [Gluconacetobacter sacchari]MBB2162606.1 flavin reductase [Gluconacetobacter sacchari]GBQ22725.1 flavin mononucleotide reductase [Gluconacetobacter sacchari DSM 12717]